MTVFQRSRRCMPSRRRPSLRIAPRFEPLDERIAPATFTVLNLNDSGADSLRQAIDDANNNPGPDTIEFSGAGASGEIALTSGVLEIFTEISIEGPGAGSLTISGNNASAVFATAGTGPISIAGLTLADGLGVESVPGTFYGGAVYNLAISLSLSNVNFTNNSATNGGAILSWDGTSLTLQNCAFTGNASTAGGGGVWNNNGFVVVGNCTFDANTATDAGGEGAAIFNTINGKLDVVASTFTSNVAGLAGGALFNVGQATVAGSTFDANESTVAGGAIANYSTAILSMRDSTLTGNTAGLLGGAILNGYGSVGGHFVLANCTISGNDSGDSGGGIYNDFDAFLAIASSTITGNTASNNGGGIWNDAYDLALANTIVVANLAALAENDIAGGGDVDASRTHHNVTGSAVQPGLEDGVDGNQVGVSVAAADLGTLGNNGGPTQTISLNATSIAIHAGDAALAALAFVVDANSTSFVVSDAFYLGVGQVVQVDDELMQITELSGTTVSALRGVNGSTPAGHDVGAAVVLSNDQRGFDRFPALASDVGAFQTAADYAIVTQLPSWTVGQTYDRTVLTTGGVGASTFAVTVGALPAGLTLQTSGALTGAPTATGTSNFTIEATDSTSATTSTDYSVTVNAAPAITTTTLPDAFLNESYSHTIAATGGTATAFLVAAGSLPGGMSLNVGTGELSGAPLAVGDYSFTIAATDAAGATATQAYTLRVHVTLTAQAQLGSQIYSGKVIGTVVASQSNTYRIDLAAGQKLSVTAQTAPDLRGSVQILDPSGQSVAGVTATSAGDTVFVQNASAATAGAYSIIVSGASGTAGDFVLTFDLDAQREAEVAGGATNDTVGTAESLTGSFYPLSSLVSRGALNSSMSYSATAETPVFQDISILPLLGTLSSAAVGDDATDTLTSTQLAGFTFPFFGTTYDSLSFSTNGLITFVAPNDSFANVDLANPVGSPTQPTIAPLWADLTTGSGGIYWAVIGVGPLQQLVIQWQDVCTVDNATAFSFQAVLSVDGTIQFNYGPDVTTDAIDGATVGIKDSGVGHGSSLVVDYDGMQPLGALVAADASVQIAPAATGAVDYYSFTMAAGDVASVTVASTGAVAVSIRDANDDEVVGGTSGGTNLAAVVDRFSVTSTGTYYVRVEADSQVTYTVAVAKNGAFDREANDTAAAAQNVTGVQGVVGYVEPGTSNGYVVSEPAYDFVDISLTGTPISEFFAEFFDNDDNSVSLTFPVAGGAEAGAGFAFPMFGVTHDHVWVNTNGLLSFGVDALDPLESAGNSDLTQLPADPAIAVFWDDLVIDARADSRVFYQYFGSGADARLIVQWNNASFYDDFFFGGGRGGLTFQAILSADGAIRLNYKSLTTGNNDGVYDEGAGASAGIKAAGIQGNDRVVLLGDINHLPGPSSPVGTGKSVALTPNAGPDWYSITLSGSQSNLHLRTSTPGDDANQWGNSLDPAIDLYDSSDVLIASGTATADGRNEAIVKTGLTPGATYKVRVLGESSTGEYFLSAVAAGTPSIVATVVNGGAIVARNRFGVAPSLAGQSSVVEQILVTFNQPVMLDADAFTITSGGAVTSQGATPSTAPVAVIATGVPGTGDVTFGYSQYVLTFAAGAGVNSFNNGVSPAIGNSFTTLKDGFYQLNSVGSKIHVGSVTAADDSFKFWSLYGANNAGDVQVSSPLGNGNDTLLVDGLALNDMYSTFGSTANVPNGPPVYRVAYDWNLDGLVDGIDLTKLYSNFGTIWRF